MLLDTYIIKTWLLDNYLRYQFGDNYPVDVINIISKYLYKTCRIHMGCGAINSFIGVNDVIYVFDDHIKGIPRKLVIPGAKQFVCKSSYLVALIDNNKVYFSYREEECDKHKIVYLPFNVVDMIYHIEGIIFITESNEARCKFDKEYANYGFDNTTYKLITSNVLKITGCNHHDFIINEKEIWVIGRNDCGQLAIGDDIYRDVLVPFTFFSPSEIKSISVGDFHTVFLTSNGDIYTCGSNEYGQLAINIKIRTIDTPLKIMFQCKFKKVVCCENSTFGLTENGDVYSCGDNRSGQLGLGDFRSRSYFKKVNIPKISDIEAGSDHIIALSVRYEIYTWGDNRCGQLGLSTVNKFVNAPRLIQI